MLRQGHLQFDCMKNRLIGTLKLEKQTFFEKKNNSRGFI